MNYTREAAILQDQIPGQLLPILQGDAFIAGGAVTSIFSSAKVNDLDVYFYTPAALTKGIQQITPVIQHLSDKTIHTDNALSFVLDDRRVQFVKIVTGTPPEVLAQFDFTICQGAFIAVEHGLGQFVFGKDFLQHLAQRRLVFNTTTKFPICSLFRLRKFLKRGFSFSGIEAIKLGLAIQNLDIDNYEDLRAQLMGIDTLFLKELTDSLKGDAQRVYNMNEFLSTLEGWLDRLDAMTGGEE